MAVIEVSVSKCKKIMASLLAIMCVSITFSCDNDVLHKDEIDMSILSTKNDTTITTEILTANAANNMEISKNNDLSQEMSKYIDRQAVEAVCIEMYGKAESDHIDYLMDTANNLSIQVLGKIVSEEDVTKKARTIWIEQLGTEYIDRIESDTIKINGEEIEYQKDISPYNVKYYEVYNTWLIMLNFPSGIREDGVKFSTPGMAPYFIIRGSNGKVIGALI